MKRVDYSETNRLVVLSIIVVTLILVHLFTEKACAAEVESLLKGDSGYQIKENASIPGISLEDELTRDQLVSDLENMLDTQAQEDLLIYLMENEDKLNCGYNLALWQYFREECR